jgi:flavodoxin|tara:strand:+ start:56 stop:304 length:249 start_codon:yes stop_codon:yes gene_type:complete
MISLKDNRTALLNLRGTIQALESLDMLIDNYSVDLPGPAYAVFESGNSINTRVQFDRRTIVIALKAQRAELAENLLTLGILS